MERFKKFIELADRAVAISESDASWETKYDMIFSPEISRAIYETNVDFDWCDPDADYVDDVLAFVFAVKAKADDIRLALTSNS
jgi:hypothetical protein